MFGGSKKSEQKDDSFAQEMMKKKVNAQVASFIIDQNEGPDFSVAQ